MFTIIIFSSRGSDLLQNGTYTDENICPSTIMCLASVAAINIFKYLITVRPYLYIAVAPADNSYSY